MRSRWDQPIPNKPHRSLSRTENSQKKLEMRKINERTRSIPSRTNDSLPRQEKSPLKINFLGKVKTEIQEMSDKTRTKSGKKLISIFKRAHQTNVNQSFLRKIPKERTQKLNNPVRSVLKGGRSEGIAIITANESPSPQSKASHDNINRALKYQPTNFRSPNQTKYRTLNYSSSRALTPEGIRIDQEGKEPSELKMQQQSNVQVLAALPTSKIDSLPSEVRPQETGSIIATARANEQKEKQGESKIPTIKKDFRQYSKRSNSRSSQTLTKERILIQQAPKEEESKPRPEKTVIKKNEPQEFDLDQLQTIEPIERSELPIKTVQKQKVLSSTGKQQRHPSPKKEYYNSIYNEVNDIDIEEITLVETKQLKKESKVQIKAQEKDWKTTLENAKQSNNPYLPIDFNTKDNHSEQQMIKVQQKSLTSKVQQQIPEKNIQNIVTSAQPKVQQLIKGPIQREKKAQNPSIKEQSPSQSPKARQKQHIVQILNKISKIHSQLQMLGQLATYFSKHSKTYKLSEDNKAFLRSESLSWHFMVYLFFKYFYYMLLLFIRYYHFSSSRILIKKEQLKELTQENEKWAQTLAKIEKSVKKNAKANTYDDTFFKDPEALKELQTGKVEGLIKLYFLQQGSEQAFQFSKYMQSLRGKIYKQVTNFIKSMNLSNILSKQSETSLIFQQSAFRVFNSTIIIYQFHNPTLAAIPTCQTIEQLDHPLLADFKNYYQKLTKQILIKK